MYTLAISDNATPLKQSHECMYIYMVLGEIRNKKKNWNWNKKTGYLYRMQFINV